MPLVRVTPRANGFHPNTIILTWLLLVIVLKIRKTTKLGPKFTLEKQILVNIISQKKIYRHLALSCLLVARFIIWGGWLASIASLKRSSKYGVDRADLCLVRWWTQPEEGYANCGRLITWLQYWNHGRFGAKCPPLRLPMEPNFLDWPCDGFRNPALKTTRIYLVFAKNEQRPPWRVVDRLFNQCSQQNYIV